MLAQHAGVPLTQHTMTEVCRDLLGLCSHPTEEVCRPQLLLWAVHLHSRQGQAAMSTPVWKPVPMCMRNRPLSCSVNVVPQSSAYQANTASHQEGAPAVFKGPFQLGQLLLERGSLRLSLATSDAPRPVHKRDV